MPATTPGSTTAVASTVGLISRAL
uniref:Uncharacterized protein n=1 Tax=Arundo donax TaxID=35708 RepID=A0A0A9HLF6_ARUDO